MHCGLSAEDLASEALNKYLLSPNGLGWRESKGTLVAFLATIMRNRFIDYLRKEREVSRTEDDSNQPRAIAAFPEKPDDKIAGRELRDRLLELIRGHKDEGELRDFIEASGKISGHGKVNQQLADLLGVGEGEVVNRRKKLIRVAGVKELYEDFGHGRKTDQIAR
jgi:RNA polymerase sigma factor (sigma-70 family)